MARIVLNNITQDKFLLKVKQATNLRWFKIAELCNKNIRTVYAWRSGETLIDEMSYKKLVKLSSFRPKIKELRPEFWYVRKGASLGGKVRQERHGNPGTPQGRRKGGLNSIKNHRRLKTNFKRRKKIVLPLKSDDLAELIGILLGDGSLSDFQLKVTLNKTTDREYVFFVQKLIERLFGIPSVIRIHKTQNCLNIEVSSKNLIEFLVKAGLCVGSKIKNLIEIPLWIRSNPSYIRACLRGLIDTDGCIYVDKHKYKAKIYRNLGLTFTNRSQPILEFAFNQLLKEGFTFRKYGWNICLRRESEIIRYFQEIGSHNPKHLSKFENFLENK